LCVPRVDTSLTLPNLRDIFEKPRVGNLFKIAKKDKDDYANKKKFFSISIGEQTELNGDGDLWKDLTVDDLVAVLPDEEKHKDPIRVAVALTGVEDSDSDSD